MIVHRSAIARSVALAINRPENVTVIEAGRETFAMNHASRGITDKHVKRDVPILNSVCFLIVEVELTKLGN